MFTDKGKAEAHLKGGAKKVRGRQQGNQANSSVPLCLVLDLGVLFYGEFESVVDAAGQTAGSLPKASLV